MDAMIDCIPAPPMNEGPLQMQVTTLDYNDYVGRIGIGRVHRGVLNTSEPIAVVKRDGKVVPAAIKQVYTFEGIERKTVSQVECGDICAIVGIEDIDIGDTIADANTPEAMPPIASVFSRKPSATSPCASRNSTTASRSADAAFSTSPF